MFHANILQMPISGKQSQKLSSFLLKPANSELSLISRTIAFCREIGIEVGGDFYAIRWCAVFTFWDGGSWGIVLTGSTGKPLHLMMMDLFQFCNLQTLFWWDQYWNYKKWLIGGLHNKSSLSCQILIY